MTGKPAASTSRLKHPIALTAITLVLVSAAAAGAWLTQPPAEAPPPRVSKKSRQAPPQVATPAPVPAPTPAPAAAPAAPIAAAAATAPAAEATPPATPAGPAAVEAPQDPSKPLEWSAVPVAELREKAEANEIPAMEELARRLVQGIGVTKDQQAGAGWLLRAAQAGSPQSAFNVGVMYERGFVVERDSTRAIEWYRKAVSANLAMAKHNLALLLRDGKGTARNGKEAVELLRSATRQGMAASMFTLGDIYERGDAAPKDPAMALAWFAMTAEFERQMNKGAETPLAKTAVQRSQALQRVLTPAELEKAQQFGQAEFKEIVAALQPPKPPPAPEPAPAPPTQAEAAAPAPAEAEPEWPKTQLEQVRAIQQVLLDLKLLRDKPDGALGPMTRNAIRSFQKGASLRETGEPSRDVYLAMLAAAKRDTVANSPLPPPRAEPEPDPAKAEAGKAEAARAEAVKAEAAKVEAARAEAAKVEAARAEAARAEAAKAEAARAEAAKAEAARAEAAKAEAARVEAARAEAAKAEAAKAEAAKAAAAKVDPPKPAMPRIETEKPAAAQVAARPEPPPAAMPPPAPPKPIDIGKPEAPPAPPTSADIARAAPKPEPAKVDPEAWPTAVADQVKIVQIFLRELHFYRDAPDGRLGPATRAAIQDYQRAMGLKISGEPNREVFDSLKEMRAITRPKAATSN